jgi:serine/threonine protein kinase
MPRVTTSATTRTASPAAPSSELLLVAGQQVQSVESGLSYRIGRLLGTGGFGQVYLATRLGGSQEIPETVCIKVRTTRERFASSTASRSSITRAARSTAWPSNMPVTVT